MKYKYFIPLFMIFILALTLLFIFACDSNKPLPTDLSQENNNQVSLAKKSGPSGDPAIIAKMHEINEQLAAMGLNIMVGAIDFFTIGQGRPDARILQQPFRWMPNDFWRDADGENITYIVDQSMGATASGLTNAQTEAAIDRAFNTWNNEQALTKVDLIKRPYSGGDITIYDYFYGFGGYGDPFAADIVNAGWWPRAFFEAVGGPGGGDGIIAFSVSFWWVDNNGIPIDKDGDNYIDTALNEVYYNDTFGTSGEPRENYPWGINVVLPGIDVETIALHENGHSLGIGHFGPPPIAVMNPIYAGIRQSPFPTDQAAMNTIWSSWPTN